MSWEEFFVWCGGIWMGSPVSILDWQNWSNGN